jgi:hypothetical protein
MMQRYNWPYGWWGLLLLLLLAAGGCTPENDWEEPASEEEMHIQLNVAFHLNDPARAARMRGAGTTRADETTPGIPVPESELKSLSLFIVDLDNTEAPLPATVKAFRFTGDMPVYTTDGSPRGTYRAYLKTKPGKKWLYLAANLSPQQESDFVQQYKSVGEKAVLTGSSGVSDFISDVYGFAMFCIEKKAIEITRDKVDYPDGNPGSNYGFELERLMTKVLLTAETYDDTYVKIGKEALGENGWLKLADVRYKLNTVNTKIYPFPVMEGGNRVDPNPWVGSNGGDLIAAGTDSKTAVRYDAAKMPKPSSDPTSGTVYTEGIYCLENILRDAGSHPDEVRMEYATHLEVTARYIPRHLYVAEGGEIARRSYPDADAAEAVIAAAGQQSATGTAGSIYTATGHTGYYTGAARDIALSGGTPAGGFKEYPGCRHTYATYIDGTVNSTTGKIDFSNETTSIFRNRYYILRVTEFDIVNGPLLQVTSTVLPWNKEEDEVWYSEIAASLKSAFEQNNYTETENPEGIPISFNMMNTTGGGSDTYNATFILTLTGSPGISWSASLSNPAYFGLYVNTEKNLAANGTLPAAGEPGVTDNGNGTVTKEYRIAVYARQPYDGIAKRSYLSVTADGMRQLINSDAPPMPGSQETILIIQR